MTFGEVMTQMTVFGVFLIVGFLFREVCRPLQKLFIPSSIVGGVIALIGGQQIRYHWLCCIRKSEEKSIGIAIR